jgi:hypothetical protein
LGNFFAQVQEQLDKISAFLPALNRVEGPDDNCYRGIFNRLLLPDVSEKPRSQGHPIESPQQLGGLLKYYIRAA